MTLQNKFKDFEERWELVNRKPTKEFDPVITISKGILTLGSAVLAGSRTGSIIAKLNVLSDFGASLGLQSGFWKIAELLLSFATVEVAIFLSGYLSASLNSEEEKCDWYKILLYCGLGTSLIANVYPAFNVLGEQASQIATVVTNLTVGIAAPVILFVTGKVSGQLKKDLSTDFQDKLDKWETRKKESWVRSKEYKNQTIQTKVETPKLSKTEESVLSGLNGNILSIESLSEKLNVSEPVVSEIVFSLEEKGVVERSGQNVKKIS